MTNTDTPSPAAPHTVAVVDAVTAEVAELTRAGAKTADGPQPANTAVGAVLALQGRAGKPHVEGMPTRDPEVTLTEIRDAAAEHLPGAHLRRRLYWHYSLLWHRDVTCSGMPDGAG